MAYYQPLSTLDASFLEVEDDNAHMHVGATLIFDAAPVTNGRGGVDIEGVHAYIESRIALISRCHQRLAFLPFERRPVWVDDERFDLHYHLKHTSLPYPGDARLLKHLAGLIMSRRLDRGKPLWEIWVVEGLEDNKFAIITKVHHCMIDGIAGADLLSVLLTPLPNKISRAASQWRPRPAPSPGQLLAGESLRRLTTPLRFLGATTRAVLDPRRALDRLWDGAASLADMLRIGLPPASLTPVNPLKIGPHRRFDWIRLSLDDAKTVKNQLGGTVNDVVLATVTGALRQYFLGHSLAVDGIDFRAVIPMSTRPVGDRGSLGNKVAALVARLPIGECDPRRRLECVTETTRALKNSKQGLAAEVLARVSDATLTTLMGKVMRLAAWMRSYNIVVTNIAGPQMPLYLLGARLLEVYPIVPIFSNQAVGIGLFSYAGSLFWGATADWDTIPDLHDLVDALNTEFEALRATAGLPLQPVEGEWSLPPEWRANGSAVETAAR
jgi:WS/DGAT/MGAT family acyltransferase